MPVLPPSAYDELPSSKLPNLTGRYIGSGRYKLVERIGQGSFGIVYLGQDTRTTPRKTVAIKNTVEGRNTSVRAEIDLQRRAGEASPDGVLGIIEVIDDDDWDQTFIVTEYCNEGDLFDYVFGKGRRKFRDEEFMRSIFLQIIDAVMACHEKGIYHRDLKPENILCVDGGERILLTDFGFATTEEFASEFGMGTEYYMSPEVLGGLNIRVRGYSPALADIWALGTLMLVMVNGGIFPWKKAVLGEVYFYHFLMHNHDYLAHIYGLSGEFNDLLKCIFTANPRNRISLEEMRLRVKTMRTFRAYRPHVPRRSKKAKMLLKEARRARVVETMEMPTYEGKGKGVDRRPQPERRTSLNKLLYADIRGHRSTASDYAHSDSDSYSSSSSLGSSSFEALREDCLPSSNNISVGSRQWPANDVLRPSTAAAVDAMMSSFLNGADIDSITQVETAPHPIPTLPSRQRSPSPRRTQLVVRNPSPPSTDSETSSSSNYDDSDSAEAITPETHAAAAAGKVSTFDLAQPQSETNNAAQNVTGEIPIILVPAGKLPATQTVNGGGNDNYTASENMLMVAARRMRMRRAAKQQVIAAQVVADKAGMPFLL